LSSKDVCNACRNLLCAVLIMFSSVVAGSVSTNAGEGQGTLLVVFDGSGSMWGGLPGSSDAKFEFAQALIERSLPGPASGTKTGLVVFGPGCSVVDVLSQPGLRAQSDTLAPLRSLNPKSKGPIAAAIEKGASLIAPGKSASMLVIADGPDNCGDPCQSAKRIATEHPGLKILVVGLGLDQPPPDLACAAQSTHGKFLPAPTAQDAETAMAEAVKIAMQDTTVHQEKPQISRKPSPARRQTPVLDPNGPPHLVLEARLAKNEGLLDKPVRWRVYKSGDDPDAGSLPVIDILEQRFSVPLAPGDYVIDAALGRAKFRAKATVAPKGPTKVTAVFDAGLVKLTVPFGQLDGEEAGESVLITVSRKDGSSKPGLRAGPFIISPYRESELILPAGAYVVRATGGPLSVTRNIEVEAGSQQEVRLPLSVGELSLSADARIGGVQFDELEYSVSVADPDSSGGLRVVARSAAPSPTFVLPAGTYYVGARAGLARASDRVALGAGRKVRKTLNLQVARLQVEVPAPSGENVRTRPIVYELFKLDPLRAVARSSALAASFDVMPGSYRIVAEVGARNASAAQDVELTAGAVRSVALDVPAGDIRLEVLDNSGLAIGGQFWEVKDNSGAVIWRTLQRTPRGLLAPGRYSVRCETRGGLVEGTFEVAAGDSRTVELRAP
jgi:Ca-activated chloride channel homolog